MATRKLMAQMEQWKTNPERGTRPLTDGGGTLAIGSTSKFHKAKVRAGSFAVIAAKRAAGRRRPSKAGGK